MTTMTTTTAVAAFGAEVRAHLAGLDAEVIDELTGGLEANLTDALVDRLGDASLPELTAADLSARFGAPADYATELCEAAGIALPAPRRAPRGPSAHLAQLRSRLATRWQRFTTRPEGRVTQMVLDSLRPLWWVLRAWIALRMVTLVAGGDELLHRGVVPATFLLWLVFLALLTVSVQWGRRRIGQGTRWRRTGLVASGVIVFLALVQLPMASFSGVWSTGAAAAASDGYQDGYQAAMNQVDQEMVPADQAAGREPLVDGVIVGGEPAQNLFVFDADGNPIEGAQIVDQDGLPVILQPDGGRWQDWPDGLVEMQRRQVPLGAVDPSVPLNAYPYRMITTAHLDERPDGTWTWDAESVADPAWPAHEQAAAESADAAGEG